MGRLDSVELSATIFFILNKIEFTLTNVKLWFMVKIPALASWKIAVEYKTAHLLRDILNN